ncbi:M48 family metallopeptidase [Porphyrobacter sp. GA68]|uniref:M48 family metallopeptidase n=1 Tax=Porphyrobacter sp. GA68 TaxID=2883480 RepID=UPI001D192AD7|nr:M48 family metallopeptidase [Porphyrobacter sp. GA68]
MRGLKAAIVAGLVAPIAALPAQVEANSTSQALQRLQASEARLFDIGWRLVTGNAAFCGDAAPAAGLLLHDADSYADSAAVIGALGLDGPIGVQAVAGGSPAEAAGLAPNMTLVAVADQDLANWPLDSGAKWTRMAQINDLIERRLAERGSVTLRARRTGNAEEREVVLPGALACPTRFELLPGSDRVVADGTRVLIGDQFSGLSYSDELLAAAVAHELAHNFLRHRERLDAAGRSQGNIRETEREADRLMPWLLANAGYRPAAAVEFMEYWGPRSRSGALGGILRARSHDGWDERARRITAELPLVERAIADNGAADWRTRFATPDR